MLKMHAIKTRKKRNISKKANHRQRQLNKVIHKKRMEDGAMKSMSAELSGPEPEET